MTRRRWAAAAAAVVALVALLMVLRAVGRKPARGVAGATAAAGRFDIVGRILDRTGRPVGAARVLCQPELGGGAAWTSTTSDGDGRYRLPLTSAASVRLRVEAEGFVTEELRAVEPPQAGLELSLRRRLGLDGLVRAAGKPAHDVEITVGGPGGMRAARSGPDGAFSFAGLAEGRYAVRALGEAGAAFVDGVVVAAGDGGGGVVTIDLKPAGSVVGRLRERGGRGIAGGEVALTEADGTPLPRTTTSDGEGSFRFAGVLPGSYVVEARAEGYYPSEPRPLRVAAGARAAATLELRLERGAVISGHVVDERAQPVAGAQLEVAGETADGTPIAVSAATGTGVALAGGGVGGLAWSGSAWAASSNGRLEPSGELGILRGPIPYPPVTPLLAAPPPSPPSRPAAAAPSGAAAASASTAASRMFVSDGNGAFRIVGLPAGRLVVAAGHADFARGSSEPLTVPAGGDVTVTVVLSRGVRIDGRVTDEDGAPVAAAEILGSDGVLAVSDRRGQYELSHFARAQSLTARASGYLPTTRAVSPSERGPFDFTLRRAEGHLAGEIVDDRGAPVSAARVELVAAPLPARWLTTDRGGRFRADGLGPGPYRVAVTHGDFAPALAEGVAPGDDFRLTLVPGGGLDGEVRDARSGAVPPGARVEVAAGEGKPRSLTLIGGRFATTALPAGRVTLTVTAPGYVTWSRPVEVAGSSRLHEVTARDVSVELERGGSIRGRVRDERGDAVAGAAVSVAFGEARLRARSDRDGEFRVDGVAAGRARVTVERDGAALAGEDVEVRAAEESRIELRLR